MKTPAQRAQKRQNQKHRDSKDVAEIKRVERTARKHLGTLSPEKIQELAEKYPGGIAEEFIQGRES